MYCYLRSLLPFYTPIQSLFGQRQPRHSTPSRGQYLLLTKSSAGSASAHRKMRAAVLLKGGTDYVFMRPTQASHHEHHNECWRRLEH